MMFIRTTCLASACLLAVSATHSEAASPVPIGQTAPTFTLKNQADKNVSLVELAKDKKVALVFIRSTEW